MSQAGRQSFTDKVGSAVKPDSQKTTTEQIGDTIKGTVDSVASTIQPNSQKTATQQAGDTLSGNSNENTSSLLDQAKGVLGFNSSNSNSNINASNSNSSLKK